MRYETLHIWLKGLFLFHRVEDKPDSSTTPQCCSSKEISEIKNNVDKLLIMVQRNETMLRNVLQNSAEADTSKSPAEHLNALKTRPMPAETIEELEENIKNDEIVSRIYFEKKNTLQ